MLQFEMSNIGDAEKYFPNAEAREKGKVCSSW